VELPWRIVAEILLSLSPDGRHDSELGGAANKMRLRQPHRYHDKPNSNSYCDSYRLNVVPSLVVPK
jgi:hypothetical protein